VSKVCHWSGVVLITSASQKCRRHELPVIRPDSDNVALRSVHDLAF
jgi:hypothetical protein